MRIWVIHLKLPTRFQMRFQMNEDMGDSETPECGRSKIDIECLQASVVVLSLLASPH